MLRGVVRFGNECGAPISGWADCLALCAGRLKMICLCVCVCVCTHHVRCFLRVCVCV